MDYVKQNWTSKEQKELRCALQQMAEPKYKEFNEKIVKGKLDMLGIRIPILRKIAKEITKGNFREFIKTCIPLYHEELLLLGIVIATSDMEYEDFKMEMNDFLKRIENWAACDTFCSSIKKQINKNKKEYWNDMTLYLRSKNNWIIRVALVSMLQYYLEEDYIKKVLQRCDSIKSEFYYVKVAQAWLIAEAYVKCKQQTMTYLKKSSLNKWTFNKAIQKICESNRVPEEEKQELRKMKK